jgi:hypothetical protein
MEKFLGIFIGIFSRIGRSFSMNMSENFLGIFPKFIPYGISIVKHQFSSEKNPSYICLEIY